MCLTHEDKEWMLEQFASRTALTDVRTEVTEMRTAVTEMRTAVTEMCTGVIELGTGVTELRTELVNRIETLPTHADLERVETSLLTAFHKWASPVEQRLRTHREALRALDLEVVDLSERVEKLEPKQ